MKIAMENPESAEGLQEMFTTGAEKEKGGFFEPPFTGKHALMLRLVSGDPEKAQSLTSDYVGASVLPSALALLRR